MEMCFHSNQPSWGIDEFFITSYSKNQSPRFISLPIILAPVISSLDEIYCTCYILGGSVTTNFGNASRTYDQSVHKNDI